MRQTGRSDVVGCQVRQDKGLATDRQKVDTILRWSALRILRALQKADDPDGLAGCVDELCQKALELSADLPMTHKAKQSTIASTIPRTPH